MNAQRLSTGLQIFKKQQPLKKLFGLMHPCIYWNCFLFKKMNFAFMRHIGWHMIVALKRECSVSHLSRLEFCLALWINSHQDKAYVSHLICQEAAYLFRLGYQSWWEILWEAKHKFLLSTIYSNQLDFPVPH